MNGKVNWHTILTAIAVLLSVFVLINRILDKRVSLREYNEFKDSVLVRLMLIENDIDKLENRR
jgi:hypothetical protein